MWLRLYDDTPDDAKLDGLTNDQKWMWVVLMCLASRAPIRGTLSISGGVPVPMESITKRTGMPPEAVSQTFGLFEEREMIHREDGLWVLSNWDKRQHESDSSTERTRKHREKKQQTERSGNVPGTSRERPQKQITDPYSKEAPEGEGTNLRVLPDELRDNWERAYVWWCVKFPTATYVDLMRRFKEQAGVTDRLIVHFIESAIQKKRRNPMVWVSELLAECAANGVTSPTEWQAFEAERVAEEAKSKQDVAEAKSRGGQRPTGAVSSLQKAMEDALREEQRDD